MRYLVLIAAIYCVVVPINGQKTAAKATKDQKAATNATAPQQSTVNVDTVNVNTLNIAKQANAPDQADQHTDKSPSYLRRLVAPENLPTLILCVVGVAGVVAAIYTYCAIRRQARIMAHQNAVLRHQTKATVRAAEAAKSGVELQQFAMQQWVDVENWQMEARYAYPQSYDVSFDIVNGTTLPLTLTMISMVRAVTINQHAEFFLVPKSSHHVDGLIELTEEETAQRDDSTFVLNVVVFVAYLDAFEKSKIQVFGKSYALSGSEVASLPTFKGTLPPLLKAEDDNGQYSEADEERN